MLKITLAKMVAPQLATVGDQSTAQGRCIGLRQCPSRSIRMTRYSPDDNGHCNHQTASCKKSCAVWADISAGLFQLVLEAGST